ncbi:MAG TPA: hypothetical protein VL309_00205 [Vicinamibacterales bacterium]|jgi:hypothetical protein|nr:hypothetical protein [Vicinamibacterales bacterium]
MEISDVKRRVVETIERSRRRAGERRARADEAGREYDRFLADVAIPVFQQVATVLRAQKYAFTVFTPSGSVRLTDGRSSDDFIEVVLDGSGDEPRVTGHTKHTRGRRILETETVIGSGRPGDLGEEDVLAYVLGELERFVER